MLLGEGMEAYKNEQYAKAVDYYQQALDIDPEVFEAYFYMAVSYSTLRLPDEAIKAMEKAQTVRPGSASVYYNLGILCKQVGRPADARQYLEKALALVKADSAVNEREQFEQTIEKALAEYH